jgi:HK97 family phage portal protein
MVLLESEEILDHPFLRLMQNPNPLLDYFGLMWLTICYLQNNGNAYWHISLDDDGMPVEIWPLPAQFMYPILGENAVFDQYEMRIGSKFQIFPSSEIVHFKRPSPLDTLSGFGNLRGVLEAAETNVRMLEFQRALFDNMAMPDFLLSPKEDTGATQLQELKESWEETYQGWLKRGQMAAVPFPVDVEQLTSKNDDLQFNEGKIIIRDEIAAGFGIPVPVISMNDTTFTNAGAGMVLYTRNTILPLQTHIAGRINKDIMPYYSPREGEVESWLEADNPFFVCFDNPVPEDVAALTDKLTKLVGSAVFSPNRALAELGEDPVPWGEEPYINAGMRTPSMIQEEVDAVVSKTLKEAEVNRSLAQLSTSVATLLKAGDVDLANVLRNNIAELTGGTVSPLSEVPKPQQQEVKPFGQDKEKPKEKPAAKGVELEVEGEEDHGAGEAVPALVEDTV